MIRFFLIWGLINAGVFAWLYILTWRGKKVVKDFGLKILFSALLSGAALFGLYFLNTISGV
jgi:hypothetical protein